jgi:hypothetical protein
MAIQPIDYSSAGLQALQGGLQTGLGLREASMRQQLFDQQQARQEKQQQFGLSLQKAWESGDNKAMVDLIASNPEQLQTIQGMMGFRDQQQRQAIGNVATQLTAALDSGNVQGAAGVIQSNAEALQAMGQDPSSLLQQLQQDPASLRKGADSLMLLTMSPDQIMSYKQKLEDQQLKRDQLNVQMRGQDIAARGQDISAGSAAADREIRRLENQQRSLDRQLARETNELKQQELRQKMDVAKERSDTLRREKASAGEAAISTFDRSIDTIDEILADPALPSAVGVKGITSYLPGSDAQTVKAKIETLKSQSFLNEVEKMKGLGALTEAEGQRLVSAIGSLDRDMPEKAFKAELNKIRGYMETRKSAAAKKYGLEQQQSYTSAQAGPAPQQAVDYLKSNPQFKAEFKQKYGYLPEGM